MTDGRPPALFLADAPALDFLNSVATPADTPVDWIASGEDLLAWLGEAGLAPDEVIAGFRRSAGPGELDAVAAQARALREWFRGFVAKHKGRRLAPIALAELAPLNRLLARDEGFSQIVARDEGGESGAGGPAFAWLPQRRWRSPEALLLPIARTMADLVCNDDFAQVKACEGPTCTLVFADRTRGHARRWCSMAVCGNRAKQAAHRHRKRA